VAYSGTGTERAGNIQGFTDTPNVAKKNAYSGRISPSRVGAMQAHFLDAD